MGLPLWWTKLSPGLPAPDPHSFHPTIRLLAGPCGAPAPRRTGVFCELPALQAWAKPVSCFMRSVEITSQGACLKVSVKLMKERTNSLINSLLSRILSCQP